MTFISTKLSQIRDQFGVRQADIAKYLNISRQTYYKYEKGLLTPSIEQVWKLKEFYDISLYYFFMPSNDYQHDVYLGGMDFIDLLYLFDIESSVALEACKISRKMTIKQSDNCRFNEMPYFKTIDLKELQEKCKDKKKRLRRLRNKIINHMDLVIEETKQENITKLLSLEGPGRGVHLRGKRK